MFAWEGELRIEGPEPRNGLGMFNQPIANRRSLWMLRFPREDLLVLPSSSSDFSQILRVNISEQQHRARIFGVLPQQFFELPRGIRRKVGFLEGQRKIIPGSRRVRIQYKRRLKCRQRLVPLAARIPHQTEIVVGRKIGWVGTG